MLAAKFNIDTSHFRQKKGSGRGPRRLTAIEVLVLERGGSARVEHVRVLRRALRESGVPDVCSECGVGTVWNGKPLQLQVDHRNGNVVDNRPKNIHFICPNCHTQTSNYGSKNRKPVERSPRLKMHGPVRPPRVIWPSDSALEELVQTMPVTKVAQHIGVSGVAVKKRCNRLGIQTRGRGYWTKRGMP